MGQKVHPEALRVGYIHDWKSTWFNEREFSDYLLEDMASASTSRTSSLTPACSTITIKKNKNEVEVNIHTARPGIVIGKCGSEVDAFASGLHRLTHKAVKVNILEIKRPELDAKARGPVDRRAAAEPRRLPARHEARAHLRHALGRQGREDPGVRPPGRGRDGAHRGLLGRARAAAHPSRRHRLRLLRGPHDLRPHRREGLDQQGRDHAQGLRAGPDRAGGPAGRRPRRGRARPRWRRARSRAAAARRSGRRRARSGGGGGRGGRGGAGGPPQGGRL